MEKSKNYQLWRVDWISKTGQRAPSTYVETFIEFRARKEANKLAQETSRLNDFDSWSYSLHKVT
tara:strand:+ start:19436 stop:19627 length:192 start_codon:yes stop_codon:yes gene_type:complete